MTFQQSKQQPYQHQHQQQLWSSSLSSMPQQEVADLAPAPGQGGKKKKKKKKKATASTDPSLAPDESATPPVTLPSLNDQDDPVNKESLSLVDGAAFPSDTKPSGEKSKARKKAAATAVAAAATATEDSAEVTTGQPSEQSKLKASQVHFDHERKDVAQAPVNGIVSVEALQNIYDTHGRQVLYSVVASGNDVLDFLDDDFMNTATSNWADDIDEYEQKHLLPISMATAAPPTTSATSSSSSAPQTTCKDSYPRILVYNGQSATQVTTTRSQDARLSSASDTRMSHTPSKPAPRPFWAQPGSVPHDYLELPSDYQQARTLREYPARPFEYQERPYGECSVRPSDYYQGPPSRYQFGILHHPPVNGPPTLSHLGPMTGRSPFQPQTYYPGRPQHQQLCLEQAMRPPRPQPASQHQHQHQHQNQHRRPPTSSVPDIGPTPAQASFKQPKASIKSYRKSDQKADNNVINNFDKNVDHTWQSPIATEPSGAWPSLITDKLENARHSSTKPTWVTRRGSHEEQGPTESQHKPEVEKNKRVTPGASVATSLRSSGDPENMRVTGPGMDTRTSPQPQCQKNRRKKQEQRRRFSLLTQSQYETQMQRPMQIETRVYDQPLDQQLQEDSESEPLQKLQRMLFYDTLPPFEDIKDFELPWMASWKAKTGPEPWMDRNKVIEFFSKRWVDARMSTRGRGPDTAVVYCSSP